MKIASVLRKAENEHVIYFLLNSYVGVARDCDKLKSLPDQIAAVPLLNKADLKFRFEILIRELDAASKRWDDDKCILIKEVLVIFGAALYRLQWLRSQKYQLQDITSHRPPKYQWSDTETRIQAS